MGLLVILFYSGFLNLFQGSMSSSQPGYRDPEGGAAYIVEAQAMAESNRLGISTVFAADSDFQLWTDAAAFFNRHFHELSDPFLIKALERILREDALVNVSDEEAGFGVVTRVTKGHLGKVIGSE